MRTDFLLDSSACVPILRNQAGLEKLPDPALTGIPAIVAAELWVGVKKNLKTHPQQAKRLEMFLGFFAVADFTLDASEHYGEIRAALESKGDSIGPLDLLIAATARSIGATLITANTREFKRVPGLKVITWK